MILLICQKWLGSQLLVCDGHTLVSDKLLEKSIDLNDQSNK
jgi:hypothetical protein